ncbi:MAG: hypothetical protein ABH876_00555 [Patescibacteria group bacterium]|nr:hypothetical protein [Patescibacteria group bacterium]
MKTNPKELIKAGWKEEITFSVNLSRDEGLEKIFKKGNQVLTLGDNGVIKKTCVKT